jgi:hypothetical protein
MAAEKCRGDNRHLNGCHSTLRQQTGAVKTLQTENCRQERRETTDREADAETIQTGMNTTAADAMQTSLLCKVKCHKYLIQYLPDTAPCYRIVTERGRKTNTQFYVMYISVLSHRCIEQ